MDDKEINNDTPKRGIVHAGFSGFWSIVSRFNFDNGGYERSPQSLTNHTAKRRQAERGIRS